MKKRQANWDRANATEVIRSGDMAPNIFGIVGTAGQLTLAAQAACGRVPTATGDDRAFFQMKAKCREPSVATATSG